MRLVFFCLSALTAESLSLFPQFAKETQPVCYYWK